jgi:Tfp pilus assembly PilM family ATPase
MGAKVAGFDENVVHETLDRATEHIASELHRQLGFFWNAAATENSIEGIYVCGGAAQASGLLEELSSRTGLACQLIEPFRGIEWSENFDEDFINEMKFAMGVSVGLATRRFGDKEHAR